MRTCRTDGQYWPSMALTSCNTEGTVDSAATPVSRSESSPMSPSMVSASSSAVTSGSVRIRQFWTTACSPDPESSPTTVCVLRTSIASNTATAQPGGHQSGRAGEFVVGNVRRIITDVDPAITLVDEHHPRPVPAGFGVVHRRVGDQDHQVAGVHEMSCGTVDPDDTAARSPVMAW